MYGPSASSLVTPFALISAIFAIADFAGGVGVQKPSYCLHACPGAATEHGAVDTDALLLPVPDTEAEEEAVKHEPDAMLTTLPFLARCHRWARSPGAVLVDGAHSARVTNPDSEDAPVKQQAPAAPDAPQWLSSPKLGWIV